MENLHSKDISNEIVEISKETSLEEVIIEPQIIEEQKHSDLRPSEVRPSEVRPSEVRPSEVRLSEVRPSEVSAVAEEPKKEEVIPETNKVSVCRIYLHLDKILLITIICCAVLMKLIIDFPEFLLFSLISIIFTSALAYGYLYPQKSMKVLERFMIMNMLVNPMAIGF